MIFSRHLLYKNVYMYVSNFKLVKDVMDDSCYIKTDISHKPKYSHISKNIIWTYFLYFINFQLLLSQTTGIAKQAFPTPEEINRNQTSSPYLLLGYTASVSGRSGVA